MYRRLLFRENQHRLSVFLSLPLNEGEVAFKGYVCLMMHNRLCNCFYIFLYILLIHCTYNSKRIDKLVIFVLNIELILRETEKEYFFRGSIRPAAYKYSAERFNKKMLCAFVCEEKGQQGVCASVSSRSVFLSFVAYLFCELHWPTGEPQWDRTLSS